MQAGDLMGDLIRKCAIGHTHHCRLRPLWCGPGNERGCLYVTHDLPRRAWEMEETGKKLLITWTSTSTQQVFTLYYYCSFHTAGNLHVLPLDHTARSRLLQQKAGRQEAATGSSSSTELHSSCCSVCCTTALQQSRSYKSSGIVQPQSGGRLLADTNNLVCCAIPPCWDPTSDFLDLPPPMSPELQAHCPEGAKVFRCVASPHG